MADRRRVINAAMTALIDGSFGCLDAAAETINARTGGSLGKGTLSKRLSGQQGWPVDDVMALEDAAGRYPVTHLMARRLNTASGSAAASVYQSSGRASKEAGEAISAALRAAQSVDGADRACAIQEVSEAIEALTELRHVLEDRE